MDNKERDALRKLEKAKIDPSLIESVIMLIEIAHEQWEKRLNQVTKRLKKIDKDNCQCSKCKVRRVTNFIAEEKEHLLEILKILEGDTKMFKNAMKFREALSFFEGKL